MQRFVMGLVGYDHRCGLEFTGLPGQFLNAVVGRQTINFVAVRVLSDDIEGLCADASGRTEDT